MYSICYKALNSCNLRNVLSSDSVLWECWAKLMWFGRICSFCNMYREVFLIFLCLYGQTSQASRNVKKRLEWNRSYHMHRYCPGIMLYNVNCFVFSDKNSKRARDMHLLKKLMLTLKENSSESGKFAPQLLLNSYHFTGSRICNKLMNGWM